MLSGFGTPTTWIHFNVQRLALCPGTFERFISWLLCLLPQLLQNWIRPSFPEWFLPSTVIVKIEKPDWDEEFENEKKYYAKLQDLQGKYIPVCYGEARCGGKRALVLSDLGGLELAGEDPVIVPLADLKSMLTETYSALLSYGVEQGDTKLDNVLLVGDKVMIFDFDYACDEDKNDFNLVETRVGRLMGI